MAPHSSPSVVTPNCVQQLRTQVEVDAVPICDPLFSPPDADIALRSLEGTLYKVRTLMLCSNSGFFNTMLSLPQTQPQYGHGSDGANSPRSAPILDVYEADLPVKTLLCLMLGIPVLKWEIHAFESVLQLAEKWDTPGPINFLRTALTTHRFIENYPLRCYGLATHFNWITEARLASSHSLTLDIFNPTHRDTLDRLSSKDLLSLFNLHHKRQSSFRQLLHCPERFVAGNSSPYYCQRCSITELDNSAWRDFKNRMFLEMERRPMGDTLNVADAGWPEAQACWESRCSRQDCRALHYDRSVTLLQIEACIALLPKTIEYED